MRFEPGGADRSPPFWPVVIARRAFKMSQRDGISSSERIQDCRPDAACFLGHTRVAARNWLRQTQGVVIGTAARPRHARSARSGAARAAYYVSYCTRLSGRVSEMLAWAPSHIASFSKRIKVPGMLRSRPFDILGRGHSR
jgi:hypothetical protein